MALWTGLAAARLTLAAESSALLEHPPNVLVATPGRLMAHCKAAQPAFSLTSLRFLVSLVPLTTKSIVCMWGLSVDSDFSCRQTLLHSGLALYWQRHSGACVA